MLALVLRTIKHFAHWLLPVAGGVAVSCAVIVGALIVGDSMRGSLRFIAMDRIGDIESFLIAPRWFRESTLKQQPSLHGMLWVDSVVAETVERSTDGIDKKRATELTLLGVDDSFWSLGTIQPSVQPRGEQLVLNRALADKLSVREGDRVTLKVSRMAVVPADSALGKRENETIALSRWEVVAIVPDQSLGRFSLRSDQRPVWNVFAPKSELQKALEIDGKINAVARRKAEQPSNVPITSEISLELQDLGLSWTHVVRDFPDASLGETAGDQPASRVLDYDQLMSDQMLLNDSLSEEVVSTTSPYHPRRVLTYLANNAQVVSQVTEGERSGREVPYSTIGGTPWSLMREMLQRSGVQVEEPESKDWVVIHRWMAEQLNAKVGDSLKIDYFLPETVDGKEVEKQFEVRVVAIAPLTEPSRPYRRTSDALFAMPPTVFNDPHWTPDVPGITDQESISSWETPFPLERKIDKVDDEYWNAHRLTPKMFISDALAIEKFGSRFGDQTAIRYDGLSQDQREALSEQLLAIATRHLASMGWRDIPLRSQQLRAASGTTPFDALFLSLSFFVIAAALMLVALLFRLAIERRAEHWGLLMAIGWTRAKVRRMLLLESTVIALIGATIGVGLGVGYAYAMLAGLRSWWVGAITVSFLQMHVQPQSLWVGWLCGVLVSIATTWLVTRQLRSTSTARLLRGRMEDELAPRKAGRWQGMAAIVTGVGGALAMIAGQFAQGQAQAGAFMAAGMFWMLCGVLFIYRRLVRVGNATPMIGRGASLGILSLSRSNAQRSPIRSILTVALMASASFLILSMSLFQAQPDRSGTGGFGWLARSAQSIAINIGDAKQQRLALASQADALVGTQIVSLRLRGGDDASCNNLYQAHEPQVIGIPESMAEVDRNAEGKSEFAWFAKSKPSTAPESSAAVASPWSVLQASGEGSKESPIPVILDQNTALWALHLSGTLDERFSFTFGTQELHFRTVGVLQNTILQGSLWIGESNFERVFPEITGYRQFLIKPPASKTETRDRDQIRQALEKGWEDEGLNCQPTPEILRQLLAVQNTYLSAFQVLGALGLLLGTLGLGVTQLRGALERSSELAAMRAMGFSQRRLLWTLSLENGWQLIRGIGVGMVAALLASAPVLLHGQSVAAIASPLRMLAGVLIVGLIFCVGAAIAAVRQPLMASLRADR